MTDTEILDYIQESITYRRRTRIPQNIQLGSLVITVGLRPKTLRELLVKAIEIDQGVRAREIADELRGT